MATEVTDAPEMEIVEPWNHGFEAVRAEACVEAVLKAVEPAAAETP